MPITLTSANYAQYINEKADAVIDFSATWCGPCKRMAPFFEGAETFMKELIPGLVFLSVDVDEQEQIARDYDISCMPTICIIKAGKNVAKLEGFMNQEKILINIGTYFDIPVQKQADVAASDTVLKETASVTSATQ